MDEHEWKTPPGSPGTPGRFLRGFRDQLRLTQEEMASKAGVDRSLIAKIEAERDVRIGTLSRIVEALGGRLVLTVRTPRSLKDMAEDHVPARQREWESRPPRRGGDPIWPPSTGSPP
jgi:transcriptional regulator with XRE-family HTH domain